MTMPRLDPVMDPLAQYLRQQNDLSLTPVQRPARSPAGAARRPEADREAYLRALQEMLVNANWRGRQPDAARALPADATATVNPADRLRPVGRMQAGDDPNAPRAVPRPREPERGLAANLRDAGRVALGAAGDVGGSLVEGGARLVGADARAEEAAAARRALRAETEPQTPLGAVAQPVAALAANAAPYLALGGTPFPLLGSAAMTGVQSQAEGGSMAGMLGVENPTLRGALDVGADLALGMAAPAVRGLRAGGARGMAQAVGGELGQELRGLQTLAGEGRLAPGLSTMDVGGAEDWVAPSFLEGLYSRLERAVEATPMKRGTGQQWLNRLQQAGAPKSEREWTGVEELLQRNLNAPLDRDQVLAAARAGRPKLQETVLRGTDTKWSSYAQPNSSDAPANNFRPSFEAYYSDVPDPVGWGFTEAEAMADARANLREADLADDEIDELLSVQEAKPPEPPDEPYTEILLRAQPRTIRPARKPEDRDVVLSARAAMQKMNAAKQKRKDAYKSDVYRSMSDEQVETLRYAVDNVYTTRTNPYLNPAERRTWHEWFTKQPPEIKAIILAERDFEVAEQAYLQARAPLYELKIARAPGRKPYEHAHWMQGGKAPENMRNPLAHIRLTERKIDGKKVLFVEELQSDVHQEARKAERQLVEIEEERAQLANSPNPNHDENVLNRRTREQQNKQLQGQRFPFGETSEWTELGLKRILDEAARTGADRVVFVTGEQAAEATGADRALGSLTYRTTDGGKTYALSGDLAFDGEVRDLADNVPAEKLDDYIGAKAAKDVREKVGRQGELEGTLSGNDLKLNNTGLRTFYGSFVPGVMQKYAKSLGVKIDMEPQRLRNLKYDQETANASFRMTPELRRKVLAGQRLMGLSLLAGGAGMGTAASQPQERR